MWNDSWPGCQFGEQDRNNERVVKRNVNKGACRVFVLPDELAVKRCLFLLSMIRQSVCQ